MNKELQTVYRKVSVDERLPDTEIQHGSMFSSRELFVVCTYGNICTSFYNRVGEHTGEGFITRRCFWDAQNVTHWLEPIEAIILSKEEWETLNKRLKMLEKVYQQTGEDLNQWS